MTVNIFQLPAEHDRIFRSFAEKHYPNLADYKKVYSKATLSPMDSTDENVPVYLEVLFNKFNFPVADFTGHSLSVSDIIAIDFDDGRSRVFFCDSVGWKELDLEKIGSVKLAS